MMIRSSFIFQRNGITYKSFHSPSELLKEESADDLKYILVDMRMPEMNGIALCKLLRERMGSAIKIFAITAQVLPDEREFLLNNGFDGLVMKPFRENELLAVFSEEIILSAGAEDQHKKETDEEETEEKKISLDLGPLRKMTFDDEYQLKNILGRFFLDS
jgi:CheY-like chemotaxis protein